MGLRAYRDESVGPDIKLNNDHPQPKYLTSESFGPSGYLGRTADCRQDPAGMRESEGAFEWAWGLGLWA